MRSIVPNAQRAGLSTCPPRIRAPSVRLAVSRATTRTIVSSARTVCTKWQMAPVRFVSIHARCVKMTLCATHVLKGTFCQGPRALRVWVIVGRAMTRVTVRLVSLGFTTLRATRVRRVSRLMITVNTAAHRRAYGASLGTCWTRAHVSIAARLCSSAKNVHRPQLASHACKDFTWQELQQATRHAPVVQSVAKLVRI